jgi:transcriptional regulator with XRE-family HTH domain
MTQWSTLVRSLRERHGLSQQKLGDMIGVAQRTVSRWERGVDCPGIAQQKRLRDLGWEPPGSLLSTLALSVRHCPVPRALSRTGRLQLVALSRPAIAKRPSMVNRIGSDLCSIATGVLEQMLNDRALQKAIQAREVAGVVAVSHGVLQSDGGPVIGPVQTTITYFYHEGTLYSDAISGPADPGAPLGYRAIPMEEAVQDNDMDQLRQPRSERHLEAAE